MKIIIAEIKNKNLFYGHIDPRYYSISTFGIYFEKNDRGLNCLLSFIQMLKREYGLEDIQISFSKEDISTYDNDVLEQIVLPF